MLLNRAVTLSAMSPTMYRYTLMVRGLFKGYNEVKRIDHFWDVSFVNSPR